MSNNSVFLCSPTALFHCSKCAFLCSEGYILQFSALAVQSLETPLKIYVVLFQLHYICIPLLDILGAGRLHILQVCVKMLHRLSMFRLQVPDLCILSFYYPTELLPTLPRGAPLGILDIVGSVTLNWCRDYGVPLFVRTFFWCRCRVQRRAGT